MIKESVGQRGKYAEKIVTALLKQANDASIYFAFERLPDARAARGVIKKTLSDYLLWFKGKSILLEVKSTEHDYRLTRDAIPQLPTLRKISKAGGKCYVLVLHKTTELWRVMPIEFFAAGVPSWDMRSIGTFPSAKEALNSLALLPLL